MSTDAQITANRANAQLSTGPRSDEGKARVSQNAVRHGLTARQLIVRNGEEKIFEEFQQDLYHQLSPVGALEEDLFRQLLHASWNLRRIRYLEAEMYETTDPLLDDAAERTLDRLARHHARFERTYHRAFHKLEQVQTNRGLHDYYIAQTHVEPGGIADIRILLKQTQSAAPKPAPVGGFDDFDDDEELAGPSLDRIRTMIRESMAGNEAEKVR